MKTAKFLAAPLMVLSLLASSFGFPINPANAALIPGGETGPIAPDGGLRAGFPVWYMDQNGLKLDLMEAADAFGISDPVDVTNPFSQQIGFNAEGFYWSAEAAFDNGTQTGLLVLALESAFAGEAAVDGEQSVFGRIRVRVDGLTPSESYVINHPFGTMNEVADGSGVINVTNDIGCFATAGITTCDPAKVGSVNGTLPTLAGGFDVALSSGIGPFLTWNTFNPLNQDPLLVNPGNPTGLYVGNPGVDHAVTGGTNGNVFSVVGTGINETQTLFSVSGRVSSTSLTEVTPVPLFTTSITPAYTFNSTDAGTIAVGGSCTSADTVAVEGDNTITLSAALGAHSDCTVTLTTAGGAIDVLNITPFTVSAVLPSTIGVARGNTFFLKNTNAAGTDVASVSFGRAEDQKLVGDWDGDGVETIGLKRGNTYFLASSNATPNVGVVSFSFGRATDIPLVGDWDGDGTDTIGLQRENTFFQSNSNVTPNVGVNSFSFGRATDTPLAGDWDGDGTDTIALKRGNTYFLSSSNTTPNVGVTSFSFGRATDIPLAGDFDGDATDTIGVRRESTVFLSNSTTTPNVGVISFGFGRSTDTPIMGLWDALP